MSKMKFTIFACTPVRGWLPALLIVLAVVLAFSSSHHGEFFEVDDVESIRDNPHIRRMWPLSEPLCIPMWNTGATVDTRPILALSLALNYQITGDAVWGFHLVNLLIHLTAALLLYGILRRTLEGLPAFARPASGATAFAAAAAVIWAVHPLQTEAVTYTVQRAVSLMGMFYLITLYCAIRAFARDEEVEQKVTKGTEGEGPRRALHSSQSDGRVPPGPDKGRRGGHPSRGNIRFSPRLWRVAAIAACALGMGTKESMVTAPVLVLLYDYVFSGKRPGALWRERRGLYLGLMSTWIVMLLLVLGTLEGMSRDAASIGVARYAGSQPLVILKYLKLAFWPRGLVLDYSNRISEGWVEILLPAIPLVILFVASLVGSVRRRPLGFIGLAFFVLLAPSSSVAPTLNVYNEHRMYLALAMVIIPVLVGLDRLFQRLFSDAGRLRRAEGTLALVLVAALGTGTYIRNLDWRMAEAFWTDNIEKRPNCSVGYNNLGNIMFASRRVREAAALYQKAIILDPSEPGAYSNLGNALVIMGETQEALTLYREAVRIDPGHIDALCNWGNALFKSGKPEEAVERFREALRFQPDSAKAHNNLANALLALDRPEQAIPHCKAAMLSAPGRAEPYFNMGAALAMSGRLADAVELFEQALELDPDYQAARRNLMECRRLMGQEKQ